MTVRLLRPLILCAVLTACGGGGGTPAATATAPTAPTTPTSPVTPPAPAATLTLSSPTLHTLAGGSPIPISAKLSDGGTVRWQLAAGAPGTLSADSGDSVSYQPPSGALAAGTTVTVTASGSGASAAVTLAVTPDPGASGLYQLSWRLPGQENEPTMLRPISLATDLAGNIYVLLQVAAAPTRMGPPRLVRIAPDDTVTELIGDTFFGRPAENDAQRLYFTSGFVADRAGNLYFGVPGGSGFGLAAGESGSGPAILKITPAGVISVLAGNEGAQTGAITDGTGTAARFLYPIIADIDGDDNIYVRDRNDVARKVTPTGVVTTIAALPASLNADMKGNTYAYDAASGKLVRTGTDGKSSVETSVPYCSDFVSDPPRTCLSGDVGAITLIGGASYALIQGAAVRRLVLPH